MRLSRATLDVRCPGAFRFRCLPHGAVEQGAPASVDAGGRCQSSFGSNTIFPRCAETFFWKARVFRRVCRGDGPVRHCRRFSGRMALRRHQPRTRPWRSEAVNMPGHPPGVCNDVSAPLAAKAQDQRTLSVSNPRGICFGADPPFGLAGGAALHRSSGLSSSRHLSIRWSGDRYLRRTPLR